MAKNRNAVRAGIFILLSLAGAIAIVIAIAGGAQFALHYETHMIAFKLTDNVGGLRKGDDVRLGGLKVGSVSEIHYVKKATLGDNKPADDSIVVWISLPAQYVIASDARVSIEASLTGVADMNITDLGTGPALPSDAALVGQPDALTAFKATLAEAGPKINGVLDKVHSTLDTYDKAGSKVQVDIHELAADMHVRFKQIVDSAVLALNSIHELLGPSTGDFHQSVANVRDITGNLKEKMPGLTTAAQDLLNKLNATIARVQGSVDDVKATLANAKEMTASARSVVVRNQGRFDEIIAGIKKTSDNLDAASVEIRASPWRLLYKPTPDEMANLNLYDAARQFAEGANSLNDATLALRDALKDEHADPARIQKLYDNLQEQFARFHQTEDQLWKKVQE